MELQKGIEVSASDKETLKIRVKIGESVWEDSAHRMEHSCPRIVCRGWQQWPKRKKKNLENVNHTSIADNLEKELLYSRNSPNQCCENAYISEGGLQMLHNTCLPSQDHRKSILKFIWEPKGLWRAKATLGGKNNTGGITANHFKL